MHPSVPANTLGEFIAYVKKNPGKLSYASQGNGSLSHVGTEMFKMQTGTSMVHIPYKGSGDAIRDVLSGQVQVFMTTPPSVMGHVQQGRQVAFHDGGCRRDLELDPVALGLLTRLSHKARDARAVRANGNHADLQKRHASATPVLADCYLPASWKRFCKLLTISSAVMPWASTTGHLLRVSAKPMKSLDMPVITAASTLFMEP